MMRLYNTLTKSIDEFTPIDGKIAKVYSCGPTVYNYAHIGNLSSYIRVDILRRVITLSGFTLQHVMNFTDVDDKTIRRSREQYSDLDPMQALQKLTRHYEQIFMDEMQQIGNNISDITFVRATESIDAIQTLIRTLIDADVAYIADDGIYFSIAEYRQNRTYGQLSKIDLPTEMKSRIDNDEYDKDSAQDFALWKKAKLGDPSWDFAIDSINISGRPGWHIECSAMAVKHLGQPFDIHTGAVDLIFPHHENEIAQSTAGNQPEVYAKFFIHNEHLLVDNFKMSKSKNNFYTLSDILKRDFSPLDFRMLILQSHYRSPSNFSWDNLSAARNRLKAWRNIAELRWQTPGSHDDGQFEIMDNLRNQAAKRLLNDIDTPQALKYIDEAINVITADLNNINHFALTALFDFVDLYLGFDILSASPDINEESKELIAKRETARLKSDYKIADRLRDELLSHGIKLRDSAIGPIWFTD